MAADRSDTCSHIDSLILPDDCESIALCGGPYSNFAAVEAFVQETAALPYRFCLGDMGGFGPHPNRTLELVRSAGIICLQGNYDDAVGNGLRDCGCGYEDERDRTFAQLSYDYTYANTAPQHREWMRQLPKLIRLKWRDRTFLLCHGSPDQVNEFVWQSETDDAKITDYLQRYGADGIFATHSGLPWLRLVGGNRFWFNVGVLGRPANTGEPSVNYGILTWPKTLNAPRPELRSLTYDVAATVAAMHAEGLPQEFIDSLETGIWTTCAAILPAAERRVGSALATPVLSAGAA